jgi:uncharacterized iron-regulated membrane protein
MRVKARTHFVLDTVIFGLFVVVMVTGLVLWFVLPGGGYRGGRNPAYDAVLLTLTRFEWRNIHNWAGLAMGILAALHMVLHLPWIVCQVKRLLGITNNRRAAPPVQAVCDAQPVGME